MAVQSAPGVREEGEFNLELEFVLEEEGGAIIKTVYESIRVEEEVNDREERRSFVAVALKGDTLRVCIRGDDPVKLRAAANTWLRLSKIAVEMVEVINEDERGHFAGGHLF
jgi:tRNA threonylcarbamoyladenosine modification (KEOPS) complex  Pcc1 subunit